MLIVRIRRRENCRLAKVLADKEITSNVRRAKRVLLALPDVDEIVTRLEALVSAHRGQPA